MITLRWAPFPEADVASYRVYRSIVGFVGFKDENAAIDGKTLELRINGGDLQVFTFNATDSIVDTINNSIVDGKAYEGSDPDRFIVRSNIRTAPGSVEIVGGTALTNFNLSPKIVTEKSDLVHIATVMALEDSSTSVEFQDQDGTLYDWYAVSTIDSNGAESAKSQLLQPVTYTGPICVIEGVVTDLQGVRLVDEEVRAKIIVVPQITNARATISKDWVSTITNPDGRFSLPLLQGAIVKLEVPVTGLSRNIKIPEKAYEFLADIESDLEYQYPLGT
jgi:hypothetical protein